MTLSWSCRRFRELDSTQLYELLALRQEVFVVEQTCPYQDADGLDLHPDCLHLLGRDADGRLLAYARLLPPGTRFAEPSVGRVVTSPAARRQGLGQLLMGESIRAVEREFGPVAIRLSAQRYLEEFYTRLGFTQQGRPYEEDGIPHVEMLRPAPRG